MTHHAGVSCSIRVLFALVLAGCGAEEQRRTAPIQTAERDPEGRPRADVGMVAPPAEVRADDVPAVVPTDLPFVLMATMVSDDAQRSRATIRDEEQASITTYVVGDAIRAGIVVRSVSRDAVVLRNGETDERLDFPREPIAMTGHESFYADFVDFDARTNEMADAVLMPDGAGYVVKKAKHAWGTPRTIAAIRAAIRRYHERRLGGPDVHVGDISLQSGGPFPPHLSHQDGRDVDIGYVLQGEYADVTRFVVASSGRLDVVRTWALLESFLSTERVRFIFVDYGLQRTLYEHAKREGVGQATLETWFQYPRGSASARGRIRHWRGHANHFHVRFER